MKWRASFDLYNGGVITLAKWSVNNPAQGEKAVQHDKVKHSPVHPQQMCYSRGNINLHIKQKKKNM